MKRVPSSESLRTKTRYEKPRVIETPISDRVEPGCGCNRHVPLLHRPGSWGGSQGQTGQPARKKGGKKATEEAQRRRIVRPALQSLPRRTLRHGTNGSAVANDPAPHAHARESPSGTGEGNS